MPIVISLFIIFLAVLLLYYNRDIQPGSVWFSLSMVLLALNLLTHYLAFSGVSVAWLAVFFIHFSPLYYLLGPFLFFYVRGTLSDRNRLTWRDSWHFLTFLSHLVAIIPYALKPWSYKLWASGQMIQDLQFMVKQKDLLLYPVDFNVVLRPISWIGYTCYCLYLVLRFERNYPVRQRIPFEDAQRILRFMAAYLAVCLAVELSYTAISIEFYLKSNLKTHEFVATPWMLVTTIGIAFLPIILLLYPEILYGIPRWKPQAKPARETEAAAVLTPGMLPDAMPSLEEADGKDLDPVDDEVEIEYFREMGARILQILEHQKPFLDPDFGPDDLADLLEVPKHHLYYCYNKVLKTRFTRQRAEYRVRHAQSLIEQGETRRKTLEAIGMKSGFSNRISFHKAFREVTGMSPSDYLRSLGMA